MSKDNVRILLSEDVSPQDIAILALISAYTVCKNEPGYEPIAVSIIQLIRHEPMFNDENEIVVIPTATDFIDKIHQDLDKYSYNKDVNTRQDIKQSIKQILITALWNMDSVETLDSSVIDMIKLVSGPNTLTYSENDKGSGIGDDNDVDISMKYSPRSQIGRFIQRMVASLHLLHFDELFLLFEAFVSYREPTRELFEQTMGSENPLRNDIDHVEEEYSQLKLKGKTRDEDQQVFQRLKAKLDNALDTEISFPKDSTKTHRVNVLPISKYNIQTLLDKQIKLLETYGQKTPKRLKDIMTLMTSNTSNIYLIQSANLSSIPSYYYIKYLECLHEMDYQGSFQALHQYFDYMVSNNSKYFYHFALISRATLHQYFGEDEKALDAIEEAISVARENRDNDTLTYILSWLFNFMRNKPELWEVQNFYHNNNELHLLDFLVKKSKTVSLLLCSTSYHFEALHIIDNGGSMNKYLESLFKAVYVSINDNLPSFIKSMEMCSVIWSRIGNSVLSDLYSEIALSFAQKTGKRGDEISIEIRKSYLKYLKGETDNGFNSLDNLKHKVGEDLSLNKSLTVRRLIMLIKINLNKGRLKYAEKLTNMLMNDEIQDIELRTELVYLNAQVQSFLGNNSKALSIISNYLGKISEQPSQIKTNIWIIMRLNLLKCHIFNVSGVPTRAISLLIQQLQQAKRVGFVSIITEGIIIFSSILNNMESYGDAYKILKLKMTSILMLGNKEYISLAYYNLSVSCFNILKNYHTTNSGIGMSQKQLFNNFLRHLNCSISGFKKSINLVMLKQCFQLEREMAILQESKDLLDHSNMSLEKVTKRSLEEIDYGYLS